MTNGRMSNEAMTNAQMTDGRMTGGRTNDEPMSGGCVRLLLRFLHALRFSPLQALRHRPSPHQPLPHRSLRHRSFCHWSLLHWSLPHRSLLHWSLVIALAFSGISVAQMPSEDESHRQSEGDVPVQPLARSWENEMERDGGTGGGISSPAQQLGKKKKRPFSLKLEARGALSLVYQVGSTVQGTPQGRQTFANEYFGMTKTFNPYGSLNWDWQVGNLRLQGDWTPFSYSPTARRFLAEYNAGSTKFTFGNLSLSLQGNQFVSFSRYAEGLQIKQQLGKAGDLTLVTFETPSRVVTETFAGKNSPGPYFLRSSPIIEGSEQVRVDERPLRRGVDYQIDYGYGQLMFATPIPPTSTIAVSYETVGAGGVGRFIGLRTNLRTGEGSLLGVTFLTQQVPFSITSSERRHRREEFQGNGTVGPFLLQTRPIVTGSEQVFVKGILQSRDVHYRIDYQTGLITFLQPVPVGALVVVEYDQALGRITQIGALRLLGLDWNARLKSLGRLSVQLGQSSGAGRNGMAAEIALGNERERFAYSLRFRRISPEFTRIDNTDFFRSESGLFADVRYELLPGLSMTSQWQSSTSKGRLFFGLTTTDGGAGGDETSSNRNFGIQLTLDRPKVPRLQLSHQRLSTRFSGTESAKTFTTAYLSHQLGQLSLEGAWEHSRDRSQSSLIGGNATPLLNLATTTRKRFSLAYRPGSKVTALLDWTQNASDSPQQQFRSKATQRIFSLSYTPWQSLQLSFSHQQLSGASSISALLGGSYLTGVAGGGFSGIGFGGGIGSFGSSYGATGFGGYGTFGVGTFNPSSFSRPSPFGGGSVWSNPSSFGSSPFGTSPTWGGSGTMQDVGVTASNGASGWATPPPSRSRQIVPGPLPVTPPRRFGGASTVTSFGIAWTPLQRLSLSLDWTTNADKGSAEVGSLRQRMLNLMGTWQLSDRLNLMAQFGRDRTSDLTQLNESLSLSGLVGLTWGRYDGLQVTLTFQKLRIQNLRLVGRLPQLDETNYAALSLSVQVPIARRWMTSFRTAWVQHKSPPGLYGGRFRNLEMEADLSYRLNRYLDFSLIWTHSRRNGDRPEQDYRASLLRAALNARF